MRHVAERLYGPLAEEVRRQSQALHQLQLVVRRIDERTAPGTVALRRRVPASAREIRSGNGRAAPAGAATMPQERIVELSACPMCGSKDFTTVCEYNKLLLLDAPVDDAARVYDYSLCHRCGIVFARRRPMGPRYRYLFERFEVSLGRAAEGQRLAGKAALTSAALDHDERQQLRRRLAHGVFVSELARLRKREYLPELQRDRLANSPHVELLGSLLSLRSPRVLELRPRLGSIGAALRRLYGAEVYAMPLFETQQMLIGEAYGIPSDHRLDYDEFEIPYEGGFDLIVANHMLTHVLRPREFLAALKQRLNPGGHVYFYNEADEQDVIDGGKVLFNVLNPFHVQTGNGEALARAVSACGFAPKFLSHHAGQLVMLASPVPDGVAWEPMGTPERTRRLGAYQRARDLAILRLPKDLHHRFAGEWDAVVERSVVAGAADFDERGRLHIVKDAGRRSARVVPSPRGPSAVVEHV